MSTYVKDLQTSQGLQSGQVFGALQVLGVARRLTETGNRDKADRIYSEQFIVDVPVGTQIVVPAIERWVLGYGADDKDNPNEMKWNRSQHRFGLGNVGVRIQEVGQPDFNASPPRQKASIVVQLCLSDESTTHRWFGKVYYHLIYLGVADGDK